MPGYLAEPSSNAAGVSIIPSGNLSSSNIQSAIYELDSEKADGISVNNSLNTKAPINNPTLTGTTVMTTASVANNLTVNGNTLFVNSSNNKVSIGSNTTTVSGQGWKSLIQESGFSILGLNNSINSNMSWGFGISDPGLSNAGRFMIGQIVNQSGSGIGGGPVIPIITADIPSTPSNSPRLLIDAVGRVTTSFQPFFTGSPTNTTGSGTSNSLYTVTNVGMSVSGGRITVPIAGKYQISFNTISNSSTGRVDASILVNGAGVINLLSEDNGTGYHQKTASIVRSLQANDYIEFSNQSWYNAAATTFEIWRTCSVVYLG